MTQPPGSNSSKPPEPKVRRRILAGSGRKRTRLPSPALSVSAGNLPQSDRARLIDDAAQQITEIFAKGSKMAARQIVSIARQSGDLREALKAAIKIVEFSVPPVKAPLVAIQNMPTFVSHLGVPAPPAAIEPFRNSHPPMELPELPRPREATRILPEVSDRSRYSKPVEDFTNDAIDVESQLVIPETPKK